MAELDGPRLEPRSGRARQLVVFLHGYGADGNDLIELGRVWQAVLPDAAFVSPHAPEPCGQAPTGRQWFPLTFRDPDERWIGVNKAAPGLARFIDAELARHQLPPSALALVGFGVLLRPNAIVAAPLLIAYVAWPARFAWKRVALLFVPAVLAGYGLIQIVYYGILAVHRDNPLHALVVFDLGGITYFTRENQFPVSWSADGYEDALLITQCYDPAHWDSYWILDPCRFVMVRLQSKDDVVFGTPRLARSWLRAVAAYC